MMRCGWWTGWVEGGLMVGLMGGLMVGGGYINGIKSNLDDER